MALPNYRAALADSSGTFRFHGWTGWPPGLQDEGEDFQRLGGTGSGSQITGARARKIECTAWVAFGSQSELLAFIDDIEELQWRRVMSLTNPWGRSAMVRITKVSAIPVKCRGETGFRADCTFEVERLT